MRFSLSLLSLSPESEDTFILLQMNDATPLLSAAAAPPSNTPLKVLLIGCSGAGKTALFSTQPPLSEDQTSLLLRRLVPTQVPDFKLITVPLEGGARQQRVQLWDTAGALPQLHIAFSLLQGAHAVAVVFDVNDSLSFTGQLPQLVAGLCRRNLALNPVPAQVLLLGCKAGSGERAVSAAQAAALVAAHRLHSYHEVDVQPSHAAATQAAFEQLAAAGLRVMAQRPPPRPRVAQQATLCKCCW